jgi:hypothetical protein
LLGFVCGGIWLLVLWPAGFFFGSGGVIAATASAASCFASGCLTFYIANQFTQPRMQAFGALSGTFVRSLFALVTALVMQFLIGLAPENYLIWLALFYMVGLGVETALLMKQSVRAKAD